MEVYPGKRRIHEVVEHLTTVVCAAPLVELLPIEFIQYSLNGSFVVREELQEEVILD
jgi:hypothetical protein